MKILKDISSTVIWQSFTMKNRCAAPSTQVADAHAAAVLVALTDAVGANGGPQEDGHVAAAPNFMSMHQLPVKNTQRKLINLLLYFVTPASHPGERHYPSTRSTLHQLMIWSALSDPVARAALLVASSAGSSYYSASVAHTFIYYS